MCDLQVPALQGKFSLNNEKKLYSSYLDYGEKDQGKNNSTLPLAMINATQVLVVSSLIGAILLAQQLFHKTTCNFRFFFSKGVNTNKRE